ncbi:hypothetical protein OAK19_00240 [Aureispira]|nr:hypothetical protein [Aureispira sp.]
MFFSFFSACPQQLYECGSSSYIASVIFLPEDTGAPHQAPKSFFIAGDGILSVQSSQSHCCLGNGRIKQHTGEKE